MKRLVVVLFLYPVMASAHPVTFEGGYSFMAEMSRPLQSYSVGYSPRWWWSTGAAVETVDQERIYSSVHFGVLLKRWNLEHAQGNFYVFGGPGYYTQRVQGHVIDDGGFTRMGAQLDFETRRHYFNARYVERRTFDGFDALDNLYDVAVGIAPYVANYSDIHTWIILRYMDGDKMRESMLSPTVRFFYRNFFWEVAMSTRGEPQLNLMTHF